ncbi:MAG: DUF4453 domain-containing protein [Gemmobacter sp.]
MRSIALAMLLALPLPAAATPFCDQLWITRNMMFHRAGHCFSSTLGQQLFGNAGCTGTNPALPAADREAVARMRELELQTGCRIDTGRGPSAGQRQIHAKLARLIDLPEPDEFGYACWGYHGAGFTLHAGTSVASPLIGVAQTRQSLFYGYHRKNGWHYIEVSNGPGTPVVAEGWAPVIPAPGMCDLEAG